MYRVQGESGGTLSEQEREESEEWTEAPGADGTWRYAVASVRSANGQEALSAKSREVSVEVLSQRPGAPVNLGLSLTSSGTVLASWEAPAAAGALSYKLYRGSGSRVSDKQGATLVAEGIRDTEYYDRGPLRSESAYAVVAVDAVGNESELSSSRYLNIGLLPVVGLKVERQEGGAPRLSWERGGNGNGVLRYAVYAGTGRNTQRLDSGPGLSDLSWEDSGYEGGERFYTVVVIEDGGSNTELKLRSVNLPELKVTFEAGSLRLRQGEMNEVALRVENKGSSAVSGLQLGLLTGDQQRWTEAFSLGGGASAVKRLVVGGSPTLEANPLYELRTKVTGQEGEEAHWWISGQGEMEPGGLVYILEPEGFSRGGMGQVRLRVENRGSAEVDLLVGRAQGQNSSDELRLVLLDEEGNELGRHAYLQATGGGVLSVAGGEVWRAFRRGACIIRPRLHSRCRR